MVLSTLEMNHTKDIDEESMELSKEPNGLRSQNYTLNALLHCDEGYNEDLDPDYDSYCSDYVLNNEFEDDELSSNTESSGNGHSYDESDTASSSQESIGDSSLEDVSDMDIEEGGEGFQGYMDILNSLNLRNILIFLFLITSIYMGRWIYFRYRNDEAIFNDGGMLENFNPSSRSPPVSFLNLQKQINTLYHDLNKRDDKITNDFDKSVKIVISQFEKNLRNLLPVDLVDFKSQLDSLKGQVNNLSSIISNWQENEPPSVHDFIKRNRSSPFSMENITKFQNSLIQELEKSLPNEIPIIMKGNNNNATTENSTAFLIIPELHSYITDLVAQTLNTSRDNLDEISKKWEYNMDTYITEYLTNELKYVNKHDFLAELNSKLESNKLEIFEEMNNKLNDIRFQNDQSAFPQYSNSMLKKLVYDIYNSNMHQWQHDLDFASIFQGTRLLNHMTSNTWKNGNGILPIELLKPSKLLSSTYWQCANENGNSKSGYKCSWAIRFQEPIYLTKISYVHGRFLNNLHMMNSAPRLISLYVRLTNNKDTEELIRRAKKHNQGQTFVKSYDYIKISQHTYSIDDLETRQTFPLPKWYIEMKPLVHSLVFQIDDNYGNEKYTSLKKFLINGLTREDLNILKNNNGALRKSVKTVPDYIHQKVKNPTSQDTSSGNGSPLKIESSKLNPVMQGKVPAFGEDELDV
ncbi:uncharacterized protein NDAI_0D02120 [Naumovozyma dairenensis CBS 421]|uniref:SUN domain-containing protein n=1 Tax=Naumovozyma dairenensis (strain ATCC 10597 / BCRC 20456 / CBS 421 / NBRC 0211 / NRRL Y-12639) TaxID=1071378 RepID=G0W9R5_NAUDC|nr:hypothetical protein NDAI_0D02120 [Naumovozyma dairenensis CBS 421]CCD24526.1 hypothetical protein NDAI_0D02120 [Naumovozyma dairenensis CBS 421]